MIVLAQDYTKANLSEAEIEMMRFAEKVAGEASEITLDDINRLRAQGFSDTTISDITFAAAARCFFSKTLDALGAEPDSEYLKLQQGLRDALIAGRPLHTV